MLKFGILDVGGTKYTLRTGQKYLVGKRSNEYSHDIELDDSTVDIKHAILIFSQSSLQLTDVCSKHGTFVDGIKIVALKSTPLSKTAKIQFGDVEAVLQLVTESDSGYLDERPPSPTRDTSEIICNSPEHSASSGIRLRHTVKNSHTSTPNSSSPAIISSQQKAASSFLLPIGVPRKSCGSNTSSKSVDSFYIPETQCPGEPYNKTNKSTDVSIVSNTSNKNTSPGDDDFFIPETQEVVSTVTPLSNLPRVAFPKNDTNESLFSHSDRIPSSQFRICTQDFNGFEDNNSNHSDDILANIPCSMVIPVIRHDLVEINDFSNNRDEEDKEMSALQWSKKTVNEDAEGSITPDNLFDVVGTVTNDLVLEVIKSSEKSPSQCSTPDIFAIPEEHKTDKTNVIDTEPTNNKTNPEPETNVEPGVKPVDEDFQPTQVFVRPPFLPPDKENVGPELSFSLPATQVFMLPPKKPVEVSPSVTKKVQNNKPSISTNLSTIATSHVFLQPQASPKASLKTQPSPKPQAPIVPDNDDDEELPPTQVFEKFPLPIVTNGCLSSTLVDCDMQQLSETSFKAKCNKLLDSDDDEMDEIIAPDLVKQMRASLDNLKSKPDTPVTPVEPVTPTELKNTATPEPQSSTAKLKVTPHDTIFRVPAQTGTKVKQGKSTVNIDNFLLTPDFLFNELPKDKQLQKQAEVNWKNMIFENKRKALFSEEVKEDSLETGSLDESQDSFDDLLPKRRTTRSKSVITNQFEQLKEKEKVQDEVVGRITRRRQSSVVDVKSFSSLPKSKKEEIKKETKSSSKPKEEKKYLKVRTDLKATEEDIKEKKGSNAEKEVNMSGDSKKKKAENPMTAEGSKKDQILKEEKDSEHRRDSTREKDSKLIQEKLAKEKSKSSKTAVIEKETKSTKKNENSTKEKSRTKDHKISMETSSSKEPGSSINHMPQSNRDSKSDPSTDVKTDNGSRKETVIEKTRSRRKETVEMLSKSKEKSSEENSNLPSGRSSRRNKKLDDLLLESKIKPYPRITRLRSGLDSELVVTKARSHQKVNEEIEKKEVTKPAASKKSATIHTTIDLTDSDDMESTNKTIAKAGKGGGAKKRKSEEDDVSAKRTRTTIPGSQSSVDSSDSGRSLRRKQKVKIASSGGPVTKEKLQRLSGVLWLYIEDPKQCDVLILEQGNRTYKLLVALARGVPVVHLNWLNQVLKLKTTDVPFDEYLFEEPIFQQRHQFVMRKTLQLARTTSLFRGMEFMTTPNITPKPEEMKDIIECSGGIVTKLSKSDNGREVYLVSDQNDKEHWHRFRRVIPNIKIVSAKSLMTSVMQQSKDALIKSIQ